MTDDITILKDNIQQLNNAMNNFSKSFVKKDSKDKEDKKPPKFGGSEDFVKTFMKENNYSISEDRFYFVDKSGKRIKNYYLEFLRFWDKEKDRRGVNKQDCLDFLSGMKEETKERVWQQTLKKVTTYINDNEEELNKLCNIVIKKGDLSDEELVIDREIFKTTFKVWVKNLKSKLLKIDHRYPLFPVLWSYKGGTGKSLLLEHLISPFRPFTHGATLEEMSNSEKHYKIYTEKMVVYCEELASASKANIEAIKDAGTRKTVQPRRFHSQDHEDEDCFSTMIFTSNSPITKVMNDPSNRRFVDIKIDNEITEDELKGINFLKVIQSIDIDRTPQEKSLTRAKVEAFVIPFLYSTKRKTPVEEFIEAACIQINQDKKMNKDVNLMHIYGNFKKYFDYQKINVRISKDTFITELCNRLGVKEKRSKVFKRCISIDESVYVINAVAEFETLPTKPTW